MPNRGKLVRNERRDFEHKFVYNVVKRAVDSSVTKSDKTKVEKALARVATQVHHVMREYEGVGDLGRILDLLAEIRFHIRDGTQAKLPPTLGRQLARQIYEDLVGLTPVLDPVSEYVDHGERPGLPAPVNVWSAAPDESGAECGAVSDADDDSSAPGDDEDAFSSRAGLESMLPGALHLLEFARSPKEFWLALMTSPDLAECRDSLERRGCSCTLKGGAKVFVQPEQYDFVVAATRGRGLKPRHVVVAEEFEASVLAATESIGKGVVPKGRESLANLLVRRTFIDVPTPSSLRSDPSSEPVTVSTSDANPRVLTRPRVV